jgi:hypothetical protein
LARQTQRAAARLHERKVWRAGVLQSGTVGSEHGKMALSALEKAPFCAIFRHFFVDFPRVFSASLPEMALGARMRPRSALLLNVTLENALRTGAISERMNHEVQQPTSRAGRPPLASLACCSQNGDSIS